MKCEVYACDCNIIIFVSKYWREVECKRSTRFKNNDTNNDIIMTISLIINEINDKSTI